MADKTGESAANAGLATHTPESIPLTEKGVRQSEAVAEYFSESPGLIVVSPYLRAEQTSEPLRRRFNSARVQDWAVHEFTYLGLARCRNTTYSDRKPLVAEFWNRNDAYYCDGEGAESFANFFFRVQQAIRRLKNSNEKFIAVFTHGQFIRAMIWVMLTGQKEITQNSMKEFYSFLAAVTMNNAAIVGLARKCGTTISPRKPLQSSSAQTVSDRYPNPTQIRQHMVRLIRPTAIKRFKNGQSRRSKGFSKTVFSIGRLE